jgi:integrin alpha FG-GAP repeat containing protein 1
LVLDSFSFKACPNAPQIHNTDFVIENIIPGDFTFDGKLDLLVMGRKNPSHANDEILMRIYKGNGNDTIGKEDFEDTTVIVCTVS